MSRVFAAEDLTLGRTVVIKVLHPELAAGVNADRFKREVQVSARLQHPHIVPVLAAGEVNGLPYYVMPFVKGESLRSRLAHGPLATSDVVSIVTDVAKALGCAHEEGIVHRDIKPDNILVTGGAAVVADFGIAKALSTARADSPADGLTSLGMSLGTPAYMAPEQVAGDPNVDSRADLYSLGCVAYELLTGQAPFAGKSPQQTLAAHVVERPVPIRDVRPDVPPALAAVVMQCLEKEPANRPQSASDVVEQLEAAPVTGMQPVLMPARSYARRWAIAAGVLLVLGGGGYAAYRSAHRTHVADGQIALAVAPFEVFDPQLALWKEGLVDVLSRNLDGAGSIRSISPSVSIKKWEGRADRTSAQAFGKRLGAQIVLYGQLQPAGRDLVDAKVWVLDATSDAQPIEVQVRDSAARMDRVTDSLSVRLIEAISPGRATGGARLGSLGSGSMPAIKAFLQGAQYFRRTQWDSATIAFREAVALDSTFGIAYSQLGQSIGWLQGGGPEVNALYQKAASLMRPGISLRDSLMLSGLQHYAVGSRPGPAREREAKRAFAAAEAITTRYPDDPEGWYLLADMRFHADPTLTDREARRLFDRSIQADSDFAPAYIHAIALAYRNGRASGQRYVQAYLARNPRDVEEQGVRLASRLADPALRPADVDKLLAGLTPALAQKAYAFITLLPDSAEAVVGLVRAAVRIAPAGNVQRNVTNMLASELSMRGHISEAWKYAVQNQSYLAGEIAALGLVPLDSALAVMRSWMGLRSDAALAPFPVLALAHDTATLQRMVATMQKAALADTSSTQRALINYVIASARAYTVLAKGDSAAATTMFDALPDSIVTLPFDQFVRARLIARTNPRRAMELLERRQASGDVLYTARELELGRIAERLGEKEKAVDAYAFVAAVLQNAEPVLQGAAKEARDALRRLDSDGKMRADLTLGGRR
jgi:serine/threonine-protein kinase